MTFSRQDGCGFADRESAARTCQRCRSEVSSGEPASPLPPGPHQGKASAFNQLPLGSGRGGRGLRPLPQAQFLITWSGDTLGKEGREKLQGPRTWRQGLEIRLIVVRSLKLLHLIPRKAMPNQLSVHVPLPPCPITSLWLTPRSRTLLSCPVPRGPKLPCTRLTTPFPQLKSYFLRKTSLIPSLILLNNLVGHNSFGT